MATLVELLLNGLMLGSLYALFALHFAPVLVPYVAAADGAMWVTTLLHPHYVTYLPWIDLWLVPTVALLLWEMERGETRAVERWGMAGLDALGAIVLVAIALGGPFTVLDPVFDPILFVSGLAFAVSAVVLVATSQPTIDLAGEEGAA